MWKKGYLLPKYQMHRTSWSCLWWILSGYTYIKTYQRVHLKCVWIIVHLINLTKNVCDTDICTEGWHRKLHNKIVRCGIKSHELWRQPVFKFLPCHQCGALRKSLLFGASASETVGRILGNKWNNVCRMVTIAYQELPFLINLHVQVLMLQM